MNRSVLWSKNEADPQSAYKNADNSTPAGKHMICKPCCEKGNTYNFPSNPRLTKIKLYWYTYTHNRVGSEAN